MIAPPKPPRHFHLLWDEDLDELREVIETLHERRAELLSLWCELYLLHFGDERTLSESEFRKIFEPALRHNHGALLRRDMDAYAASVLTTGRQLAQRHVPLDEMIATAHLLQEAAQAVLPRTSPPSMALYNKFDKLSHVREILLASAYSGMQSAAAATRIHALELEARGLPPQERTRFHGLVGQSLAMRETYRAIEAAAHSAEPLLITGEPGAGKGLAARAIHECGAHQSAPFVVLRCALLPGYLIESELFGYRRQRNAVDHAYLGLYGAAEGGTLFLDEITKLPVDVQYSLARTVKRSRTDANQARIRILASTGRDPDEALRLGQIGKDFAALFTGRPLRVPTLRERREDIALLAWHFIDLLNRGTTRSAAVAAIDDAAMGAMRHYVWPGNVRELFETIQCAARRARSSVIGLPDLPATVSGINGQNNRPLHTISFETFADAERAVLKLALEVTGGNKLQAARMLKISRKKVYTGIAKYGLKNG